MAPLGNDDTATAQYYIHIYTLLFITFMPTAAGADPRPYPPAWAADWLSFTAPKVPRIRQAAAIGPGKAELKNFGNRAASRIITMDIIRGVEDAIFAVAYEARSMGIVKCRRHELNWISPRIIDLCNHQHTAITRHGDH